MIHIYYSEMYGYKMNGLWSSGQKLAHNTRNELLLLFDRISKLLLARRVFVFICLFDTNLRLSFCSNICVFIFFVCGV